MFDQHLRGRASGHTLARPCFLCCGGNKHVQTRKWRPGGWNGPWRHVWLRHRRGAQHAGRVRAWMSHQHRRVLKPLAKRPRHSRASRHGLGRVTRGPPWQERRAGPGQRQRRAAELRARPTPNREGDAQQPRNRLPSGIPAPGSAWWCRPSAQLPHLLGSASDLSRASTRGSSPSLIASSRRFGNLTPSCQHAVPRGQAEPPCGLRPPPGHAQVRLWRSQSIRATARQDSGGVTG
jgi:hypothetical protein